MQDKLDSHDTTNEIINGTDGNNILQGTRRNDEIYGH